MQENQLDLFAPTRPDGTQVSPGLVDYWRAQLREGVRDIFEWRHDIDTTGWSVAIGDIFLFPRHLFRAGDLTRAQYRRYRKFYRRCQRWERLKLATGHGNAH